ncbi:MAG TPA: hypothetical protein VHL11_18100 [Phototrophicaceae bacterium]|jgi:hypothetical protein|nr:hypothetical protein [Phototrophicaceae bacterium]
MSQENIFADEWRECLREHYKNVVRNDRNPRNLESVKKAFLRPNGERPPIFAEDELHQLYIEATMRAEDMPDDFLPEMLAEVEAAYDEVQSETAPVDDRGFQPHPLECQCPECVEINLTPHNHEGQPLDDDALAELDEETRFMAKKNNEPAPTQLSLF